MAVRSRRTDAGLQLCVYHGRLLPTVMFLWLQNYTDMLLLVPPIHPNCIRPRIDISKRCIDLMTQGNTFALLPSDLVTEVSNGEIYPELVAVGF